MNKKRLIITSVISIILVSILFIGSTYSIFTSSDIDENLNSYTTGNLSVTIEGENSVSINDNLPISGDKVGELIPYRIVVRNTGNVPYMFNVILADTTAGDVIDYKYVMTKVGKLENKSLDSCTSSNVTVNGTSYTGRIIKEGIIIPPKKGDVETVVNIDVRVWVSDTVQNTEIGKSFYGKLLIDGQAVYDYNEDIDNSVLEYPNLSLYSLMKKSAVMDNTSSEFVSSSSGISFSAISSNTNGKGLYIRAGTENDTYPIYYYRGNVTNNNVIFANFCWKIVRTTETGGTKLIYNGTPTDGTCDNTGESSQIGTSKFNSDYSSLADVGYMVGDRYTYSSKSMSTTTSVLSRNSTSSSSAYYYGTGVTYSGSTYTLNSAATHTWSSDYGSLSGYYTCRSTSTSCSTVYYIVGTSSSYMYTLSMSSGNLLNDVNTSFVLGSSVTDNGDGTYTLSNTTTIKKSDWFSNYSTYNGYYTCDSTSTTCSNMYGITSTNNYQMVYSNIANNYVYGNTVSYSGGLYTLSNTKSFWNWYSNYNTLSSNHYTCFSTGTTCSTVYYVYYTGSSTAYYISLTNGKTVENALSEMLSESSNANNSTIKTSIDTWYQTNMTEYTDNYLEDTVWCNDRSIGTLYGWDPNGESTTDYLYFSTYNRAFHTYQPSLSCSNPNDKFTVSSENGNGKLTYPVALLTADEIMLAGGRGGSSNNSYYLCTGTVWWALSPFYFDYNHANGFRVNLSGYLTYGNVNLTNGVRPVVSLKPGIEISDGDGTISNPYVIS